MNRRNRLPVVAIVGRTNVGKSTLFNVLCGKRIAIVEDTPGVTRDRSYTVVAREKVTFQLVDTGGLFGEDEGPFSDPVRAQAELAIAQADLILAVFDGQSGPHPDDPPVADLLRRSEKPVLWVINKCEKPTVAEGVGEFYGLGIQGDLLPISAAHNEGISQLFAEMKQRLAALPGGDLPDQDETLRIAVIGKPNVGKSTFVNRLLGEERVITSDLAGTTRDAIDIELTREGQHYTLVDTAGLRKKGNVAAGTLERFSNLRTLRALAQSDVAVILFDAEDEKPLEQDAKIAGLAHDRGIPFVVVVNKWDAVEKDHRSAKEYTDRIRRELKFCPYAPVLYVSALSGKRCPSVLAKARAIHSGAQVRVGTSELNKLLERAFIRKPAPVYRGQPIKLFFATQIGVLPPTFLLFVNHPRALHFSYQRYLKNVIRKEYGFEGSDVKLIFRKRGEKQHQQESVREEGFATSIPKPHPQPNRSVSSHPYGKSG